MALDGDGPSELVNATLHHKVAARVGQVSALRRLLTNWAIGQQIPDEMVDDMRLAAEEAMTNAVMHAYPAGTPGTMTLMVQHTTAAIVMEVRDTGRWGNGPSRPGGGHGIKLIRALAPQATITSGLTGTTVRLAWPWTPPPMRADSPSVTTELAN